MDIISRILAEKVPVAIQSRSQKPSNGQENAVNQPQPPPAQPVMPDDADRRTQTVRLPEGWMPDHFGGWSYDTGANLEDGRHTIDLFMRPDDPDWTLTLTADRADPSVLLTPVSILDADNAQTDFWPDCVEDLQALLLQVGRYGSARPAPDGWEVNARVTAAAARAATIADSHNRLVRRDTTGTEWVFADTGEAVPTDLAASPAARLPASQGQNVDTDAAVAPRHEPSTGKSVAASASAIVAALNRPSTAATRHEPAAHHAYGSGPSLG
jgi:hypothetical protein